MNNYHSKERKKSLSPGSLIYSGPVKVKEVTVTIFEYTETSVEEKTIKNLDDLKAIKENDKVNWINVTGLHDVKILEEIGNIFEIHPLTLEDILNLNHSPKVEEFESYLFIIAKMIDYNKDKDELDIEHISFILGKNFLITFQEKEGDVFDLIRDRIRNNKARIRKLKNDYLMYRLLDATVDNYLIVLDCFDERIEKIEDTMLLTNEEISLEPIHEIRKEILKIKRAAAPLSEIIHKFEKDKFDLIHKNTRVFLRDLYDHTKHVIDTIENYRELLNNLLQVYLSTSSDKMNKIVKLLTIISTIFIPLTFIVGVYGMNFSGDKGWLNMPELHWKYGYPAVMVFMFLVAIGLIIFFKRKKWL
ncbi:MAG: magnesium/cobalt transporter CorA [Ignavibacteriaceae bacterium]